MIFDTAIRGLSYAPDVADECECSECGEMMEISDSGTYRNREWNNYRCPECGNEVFNEPYED